MSITAQLIEACKRDKTRAQIRLFELCYPNLMPVCRRYVRDAEAPGMLNIGFYKVLRGLRNYEFTGETRFLQWSRKVLINAIIDELRKQKKYMNSHVHTDHAMMNGVHAPATRNMAELELDAAHIHAMIRELPEMHARVFNLYVIDSYSHQEIAQMFEISENTSRWYLLQARKLLQAKLAAHLHHQEKVRQ
ncbi:MAG: RNA polymerase sigma factor [Saprospiraceae bacterium]|nr:RNA polymerase sigma factor [Saprospiraceae bacterium]